MLNRTFLKFALGFVFLLAMSFAVLVVGSLSRGTESTAAVKTAGQGAD